MNEHKINVEFYWGESDTPEMIERIQYFEFYNDITDRLLICNVENNILVMLLVGDWNACKFTNSPIFKEWQKTYSSLRVHSGINNIGTANMVKLIISNPNEMIQFKLSHC